MGAVAAALRVGSGPEVAWRRVGVRTDDGVPRPADLLRLGGAGQRQVGAVVAAARLSLRVGTPAAELLERATVAVARDVEAEGRRRTALAGPRATANLLVWLPAAGLVIGVAVGARPWEELLGGGAGSLSALVGLALLVVGRRWTAREIRTAERAGDGVAHGALGRGVHGQGVRGHGVLGHGAPGRGAFGGAGARAGRWWPDVGGRLEALTAPGAGRGPTAPRPRGRGAPAAGTGGASTVGSGARRWVRRRPGADVLEEALEDAVVLDLVDGACQAGVGVPQALDAVGAAVGGRIGEDLRSAARRLTLGAPWDAAWSGAGPGLRPVVRALRPAWEDGVPPGALLRTAAEAARRDRDARAAEAAARLGVRLVVPLGLCHLPAFVLVGLVPVLGSMATTTLGA